MSAIHHANAGASHMATMSLARAMAPGWNVKLFESIHATDASAHWLVAAAAVLAEAPLCVALGVTAWLVVRNRDIRGAFQLAIAMLLALLIEAAVSRWAFHPRPFAAGLGHAWVAHAANNSMPSTHVTLAWVAAGVLFARSHRLPGAIAFLCGAVLAWARIYVGIHWPGDMLGAGASAIACVLAGWAVDRLRGGGFRSRHIPR